MTTPTPDPNTAQPNDKKPAKKYSPVNKKYLDELTRSGKTALEAAKPKYAAAFTKHNRDAAWIKLFGDDVEAAAAEAGVVLEGVAEGKLATEVESKETGDLRAAIHAIQTDIKLTVRDKKDPRRKVYWIGEDLSSEKAVVTAAKAIIGALGKTPITGVDSTDLAAKLKLVPDADSVQTDKKGEAREERGTLAEQVDSIADRRNQIELIIDREYPYTNPVNAPVRAAYGLPANRPVNG